MIFEKFLFIIFFFEIRSKKFKEREEKEKKNKHNEILKKKCIGTTRYIVIYSSNSQIKFLMHRCRKKKEKFENQKNINLWNKYLSLIHYTNSFFVPIFQFV